ncbi:hypothetical protein BCR44DRAFT_1442654 [Catenaria anguillulae PL171]|uniref:Uncharacterized protein n=1 Tax=Catenaria anguillulae PL171 TaxID=765915 RepID=A0A1Y2H9Q7_9FUNG|nr:hypothetical protein BCR44DRAFT_1442654 [Catenaria anguillulae PL171]
MCITVTHSGLLSVWNTTPKDKWSAFAPDFKEIEDNIEYEEQEDEFDLDPLADDPLIGKLEQFRGPDAAAQVATTATTAAAGGSASALPRSRSAVLDLVTIDDGGKDPTAAWARADPEADTLVAGSSWAIAVRLEDMASLPGYDHHLQHLHLYQDGGFAPGDAIPGQVGHAQMMGGEQPNELMASLASSAMGLVSVQKEEGAGKGSKRKRDE